MRCGCGDSYSYLVSICYGFASASLMRTFRGDGWWMRGWLRLYFLRDLCLLYCCIIIFARNPMPETCSTHRITNHSRLSDIQEHERSIQGGIVPARDEIARRVNGRSLRPLCNTRARVVTSATRFQIPVTHRDCGDPGGARGIVVRAQHHWVF